MIQLDRRVGSVGYQDHLKGLGLPVHLCTLPFGDAAWQGRGAAGKPVRVGVEIKKLGDLLNSIRTGRLVGHQLPGLLAEYDHVWLIIEGLYRVEFNGCLSIRQGRKWTPCWFGRTGLDFRTLTGFLCTMEVLGGCHTRRTLSPRETARTIAGLYTWWTSKDLDQHRAHRQMYREDLTDRALLAEMPESLKRRRAVAAALPGIGYDRSLAVAKHFPSITAMALADRQAWAEIDGIGRVLSDRIVSALTEESHT